MGHLGMFYIYIVITTVLMIVVLPKFGSEPKFEPEPLGPNSKFSSRFRIFAELNLNPQRTGPNRTSATLNDRLHVWTVTPPSHTNTQPMNGTRDAAAS